jgi:hypothetical protein
VFVRLDDLTFDAGIVTVDAVEGSRPVAVGRHGNRGVPILAT